VEKCEEDDREHEREGDEGLGRVLESAAEKGHDLVESEQLDELDRRPEHEQTDHVQHRLTPVRDRLTNVKR